MHKSTRDFFKETTGVESAKPDSIRGYVETYRKNNNINHDEPVIKEIETRPNNSPYFDKAVSCFCDFMKSRGV